MRIYALGDIHDDLPALRTACDYISAQGADLLLVTGDFLLRPYSVADLLDFARHKDAPVFIRRATLEGAATIAEMRSLLNGMGLPYNTVHGNYDPSVTSLLLDRVDVHSVTANIGDHTITGFGGANSVPAHIEALTRFGWGPVYDDGLCTAILGNRRSDILLLHTPPLGMCDTTYDGRSAGSAAIASAVVNSKPALVVCGHIHESGPLGNNPAGTIGIQAIYSPDGVRTTIINPGNLGRFSLLGFPSLAPEIDLPYGTFVRIDTDSRLNPTRVIQYRVDAPDRRIGDVRVLRDCDLSAFEKMPE